MLCRKYVQCIKCTLRLLKCITVPTSRLMEYMKGFMKARRFCSENECIERITVMDTGQYCLSGMLQKLEVNRMHGGSKDSKKWIMGLDIKYMTGKAH